MHYIDPVVCDDGVLVFHDFVVILAGVVRSMCVAYRSDDVGIVTRNLSQQSLSWVAIGKIPDE